ncbi:MAG TPA: hypothetical protein VKJ65_04355, partial [Phycisphaerae bacterium]|nr:hypothetical protein [Phycisphaerae bacterium]
SATSAHSALKGLSCRFRALYFLGDTATPHPPQKTWRLGEVPSAFFVFFKVFVARPDIRFSFKPCVFGIKNLR